MFVSFYDIEQKKMLKRMEEMPETPCPNDRIVIDGKQYVVEYRVFALEKKYRACAYVKRCKNKDI